MSAPAGLERLMSRETRLLRLDDGLDLESGRRLRPIEVAYRTWGSLSPRADNVVLVCHALTGSADVDQWWPGMLGAGRCLDPRRDLVICANVLGSCYGTTGPASLDPATGRPYGSRFPEISIRDLARLQRRALDELGVSRVDLLIGGSLGGMVALELLLLDSDRIGSAVIVAACARHSPWCIALSEAQRAAIEADPCWCDGAYEASRPPRLGLAAARMMAMCTYRSPQSFAARFGRSRESGGPFSAESYLRHHGRKLVERFDARSYITLSKAADSHDVAQGRGGLAEALSRVRQPVLVVGIDSDQLYLPAEQQEMARLIPGARLRWLRCAHGHDSFLIAVDDLNRLVLQHRSLVACRRSGIAC